MKKMDGRLCLAIVIKVDINGLESFDCASTYAENVLFKVEHKQKQYIFNLIERTYEYRR